MINLEDKTLAELKELAKENNIKNISKLKKEELVQVLEQVINSETISTTEITKKNETDIKDDENNNQEGYTYSRAIWIQTYKRRRRNCRRNIRHITRWIWIFKR